MKKSGSKGFTLLEVMVAVAILGMVMTLVWSTSSQSMRAKKRVDLRSEVYHQGTIALRKISEDLSMAFLAKMAPATPGGTPTAMPGMETTEKKEQAFKTFFIGEDRSEADQLRFTALSHMRLFKNAKESDQCKISYEIAPSKEYEGVTDLVRRQEAWLDDTTEVKAEPMLLSQNVKSFNIEYYDAQKTEWRKDWNTESMDWQNKLPEAVKITITFKDPNSQDDNTEVVLSTAVGIALFKGPIEF